MYDRNGTIRAYETLGITKSVNNNYLRWYSFIQAIPGGWRKKIAGVSKDIESNQEINIGYTLDGKFVPLEKAKSNLIYQHFIKKGNSTPKRLNILKNHYGLDLDIQKQKNLFLLPWKVTIDSRLRWLQFRITHLILPTNKWLHRIGLIESPNCNRCKTEIETLDHIFIECPEVKIFWEEVIRKWNFLFEQVSNIEKLFGILDYDIDDYQMKNQILLTVRRYICMCKYRESSLSITVFNILLKDTARLEEELAKQRGSLGIHYQKWEKSEIYNTGF